MLATLIKKSTGFCVLLLILSLTLGGCTWGKKVIKEEVVKGPTLRVLYCDWPPDMLSYLAQEKGFFKKQGLDVELVRDAGLTDAAQKRKKSEINIWTYPLIDFLTEYVEKIETEAQIIYIEDFSAGADGVITFPEKNLKSVSDLKGKKVGVEMGTIGEFFLQILLEREDLKFSDIEIVDLAFDEMLKVLKEGGIDAGVTYEPVITEALSEGAVVLVDSKQERGVIVDAYVAKKDHVEKYPEQYKKFLIAILETTEYFNNNPKEAAEIIKGPLGMTTEEVLGIFNKLKIPDLRDNQVAFDRSSGYASLYSLGRLAQKYLEERYSDYKEFDLEPLINSELVNTIKKDPVTGEYR